MGEIFIKKLANYRVIANIEGHPSKNYSFYSKRNTDSVVKHILNTISDKKNNRENKAVIVFQKIRECDDDGERYRRVEFFTDIADSEQLAQEIAGCVSADSLSFDVKHTRFTIRIRNNISCETDTKDISFNEQDKSFDDLFSFIRFIAEQIQEQSKNQMLYISDKPIKSSHTIILMTTGTAQRLAQPVKSFSINIPYFSSQEIAEMFQGGDNHQ